MNAQVPILIKEATCPSTWISLWVCSAATRCNTLQHAATRCNVLQHAATDRWNLDFSLGMFRHNTMQHTATRCNTLQHDATYCNTLQQTIGTWISLWVCSAATRCNTLQHAATRCNTLQHVATRCNRQVEHGFLFVYVPPLTGGKAAKQKKFISAYQLASIQFFGSG